MSRRVNQCAGLAKSNKGKARPRPQSPTRNQLARDQIQAEVRAKLVDQIFSFLKTAARWLAVVFIFRYLSESAKALAGQNTSAVFKAAMSVGVSQYAAWAISLLTTGVALNERRLRKNVIKELGAYPKQLESHIDPDRMSSRLTELGEPTPEDLDGA